MAPYTANLMIMNTAITIIMSRRVLLPVNNDLILKNRNQLKYFFISKIIQSS